VASYLAAMWEPGRRYTGASGGDEIGGRRQHLVAREALASVGWRKSARLPCWHFGEADRGVGRGHVILPRWGAVTSPQANPAIVAAGGHGEGCDNGFLRAGQGSRGGRGCGCHDGEAGRGITSGDEGTRCGAGFGWKGGDLAADANGGRAWRAKASGRGVLHAGGVRVVGQACIAAGVQEKQRQASMICRA
jgi:hypothetical protein